MNKVSIIITTYNRIKLLKRAIYSALNQTYNNIEIIIIDDNSNDSTEDIIKNMIKQDNRLFYYKNIKNKGANYSRNIGIKNASGKFIAGLDDDDEFLPNRIQLLVNHYNSTYSFITSNNILVFPNKIKITNIHSPIYLNDMFINNAIYNQGLIERKRLIQIGLYDENLSACQDYDMWMRLILKYGSVKVIKEATQKIYVDNNIKRISTNSISKYYGYFNFYKKYKYLLPKDARKIHLIRIYDIRTNSLIPNILALKIIEKKILSLNIKIIDIYGTGIFSEELCNMLHKHSYKIRYIFDTNAKEGQKFYNINVLKPDKLDKLNIQHIIIASVNFYPEIKNTILKYLQNSNIIHI